ncbi:hypothetical protein [Bacillus cereus]|uniref:hypothetical protein n=1 Tax=Bacillus cereus TaxID=1396 RepID=UPI000BFB9B53|nr:hypothetical protein [Bacillus cereus]MEB9877465.1 hypothetical protein [Bacillus cereus]PGN73956.1 hypothetical protein CN963_29665 [Bacillus cereus]
MTHEFEYAWSIEKPSSESHAWSYKQACDACLQEIERQYGIDYRITDVTYDDLGRETNTHTDRDGSRHWKCTHKVKAHYDVVRRGSQPEMHNK